MQLTERDHQIIRLIYRHRFLRSSHIIALVGGSSQQILRRLKLLYHHGFLERPRSQIDYFHRGGSHHIVYGLGNKAAKLLKEFGIAPAKFRFGEKNRAVGKVFLNHAILVSEIMVAVELACRKASVDLIYGEEISLPGKIRIRRQPFQWKVNVNGSKLTVFPDQVFALKFKNGKESCVFFFLEADRGTMPVTRKKSFADFVSPETHRLRSHMETKFASYTLWL